MDYYTISKERTGVFITQFFTGQMPLLLPNQQRQSTEGIKEVNEKKSKEKGSK